MRWGYGLNWPNRMLMMLGSTLWIVCLAVLAWVVIRWLNHRTTSPTAGEILSQRYARGEIDATTLEQMRERLEAADNADQRSWAEGRRPAGESLFDGPALR